MKIFSHGILGMNARNLQYIRTKNSIESISLADSKLKTKHFLSSRGIPFAETYITITSQQDLKGFSFTSIRSDYFVVKPNKGSGGKGILIVRKEKDGFVIQGEVWTEDEIKLHMIDILHGSFSLHGSSDTVVIEELLTPGKDFSRYCKYGLADIRVIVYNYVPITAMIRMPTIHSGGKANLAQGGIGLGLNIANGQIISLFQNKKIYTNIFPIEYIGLQDGVLPFWDDILLFSSQVQMYTKLGYLALDWVITKNGPKLLEINARAGLEIQNVNLVPLASRLKKVADLKILSPEKGVEVAKALFHTETLVSEKDKKILYLKQRAVVNDREIDVVIDMTRSHSYVAQDILESSRNQPIHILTLSNTSVTLDSFEIDNSMSGKIILGAKDIKEYLINPNVYIVEGETVSSDKWTKELIEFDDEVYRVSKKVNLSSLLRPTNYFEALDSFIQNSSEFNPVFGYHFPTNERLQSLRESLNILTEKAYKLQSSGLIIAELYIEKIKEVENKLSLLQAYKDENHEKIASFNTELFGKIDQSLFSLSEARALEMSTKKIDDEIILGRILTLEEIIVRVHAYFETHKISKIPITIESGNLSRMSVSYGREVKLHISKNAIIRENEIDAILSHEIGTHLQRYIAGGEQGLKLFQFGTGYYLADEEGFAIYRSFSYLREGYKKNAMYMKYYLLGIVDTLSFSQTVEILRRFYPEKSLESLFSDAVRMKRGITHSETRGISGTTYQKDKIYLDGYTRVKAWIEQGGKSDSLFFGKIKIQDLKIIELL